jgi:hypothetical protein
MTEESHERNTESWQSGDSHRVDLGPRVRRRSAGRRAGEDQAARGSQESGCRCATACHSSSDAEDGESPVATAEKSSGGQHEGIKVHGHWTITIRKEDGSVASRHEFENELVNPLQLLRLLARETSMGRWEVEVGGTPQPCGLTTAGACSIDVTVAISFVK